MTTNKILKVLLTFLLLISVTNCKNIFSHIKYSDIDAECTNASCIKCPTSPSVCSKCVDGYFLEPDDLTCVQCPDGCTKCKSIEVCTSCTAMKELSKTHCVFKRSVLYIGLGCIVFILLVAIGGCWLADKKMR